MFALRMWPWVSLTMAMILCLTLSSNDVTDAKDVILIGTVYCDTCFHQHFSPFSHFISGASVAVECGGDDIQVSGKRPRFREEVKTDAKGEFRVILPFSATKHVDEIRRCSVKLISSSEPDCAVAAISTATSSSIRVKVKTTKNHVFSTGYFTFQPLEEPKRCKWESHANSNDEIIVSTPLPSPVVEAVPPLAYQNPSEIGLHDLADENNFGPSLALEQILSPLLVPSFPSQPPPDSMFVPEAPPPPDSMLDTRFQPPPDSMSNTGFQSRPPDSMNMGFQSPPPDSMNMGFQSPPPDSMFNTGFQSPPPDSMFNTGLQSPPPDSMFNTGFQSPPPDSMFNTGFQSPPPDSMFNPNPSNPPTDSTFDPSQQSPPSSTPQLTTPPPPLLSPSLPIPPLDPQPDLIQATPPPPFNPPFPAFPFQPSAGLPRMPPETRNHHCCTSKRILTE